MFACSAHPGKLPGDRPSERSPVGAPVGSPGCAPSPQAAPDSAVSNLQPSRPSGDSSLANVSDCNCMTNPQENCVLEPSPNLWPTKSQEKVKPLFEVAECVGPSVHSRSDSTLYIVNRIRQRRTAGASSGRRGLQSHEERGPGDTQLPGSLLKRLGNLGERK